MNARDLYLVIGQTIILIFTVLTFAFQVAPKPIVNPQPPRESSKPSCKEVLYLLVPFEHTNYPYGKVPGIIPINRNILGTESVHKFPERVRDTQLMGSHLLRFLSDISEKIRDWSDLPDKLVVANDYDWIFDGFAMEKDKSLVIVKGTPKKGEICLNEAEESTTWNKTVGTENSPHNMTAEILQTLRNETEGGGLPSVPP